MARRPETFRRFDQRTARARMVVQRLAVTLAQASGEIA
jgi:hypothetical protein